MVVEKGNSGTAVIWIDAGGELLSGQRYETKVRDGMELPMTRRRRQNRLVVLHVNDLSVKG